MADTLELMEKFPDGSRERTNLAWAAEVDSYRFKARTDDEGSRRLSWGALGMSIAVGALSFFMLMQVSLVDHHKWTDISIAVVGGAGVLLALVAGARAFMHLLGGEVEIKALKTQHADLKELLATMEEAHAQAQRRAENEEQSAPPEADEGDLLQGPSPN